VCEHDLFGTITTHAPAAPLPRGVGLFSLGLLVEGLVDKHCMNRRSFVSVFTCLVEGEAK